MRERLNLPNESKPPARMVEQSEKPLLGYERVAVTSKLAGPNGEHAELKVAVSKDDGCLREVNFWDLDMTLIKAEQFHGLAVEQIFPEAATDDASREDLHQTFFAGFKLGNSFREWDRMWRIYREGQVQYRDPAVYAREFLGDSNPKRALIDEPGHPEGFHERANEILQRYGAIAFGIMEAEYKRDPENFRREFVIPEMMQLLAEKTRLGQVNVYMTANQRDFARGLVAFLGLSEYGLALATDETMAGGGKEIAIEKLIVELAEMGLRVNRARATAAGDSIKGDVGSGTRAMLRSGILVTKNSGQVEAIKKLATTDPEISRILHETEVDAVSTEEVPQSRLGIFKFGKASITNKKSRKFEDQFNKREWFETAGGKTEVLDINPKNPKSDVPVFLAPGWGVTIKVEIDEVKTLVDSNRRVVTLNYPRTGGDSSLSSEESANQHSEAELRKALTILDVLEKKGIEKTDMLLHSESGVNGVLAATLAPEKFRNIILYAPGGLIGKDTFTKLMLRFGREFSARPASLKDVPITATEKWAKSTSLAECVKYIAANPVRAIKEAKGIAGSQIHEMLQFLHNKGIGIIVMAMVDDRVFPMERMQEMVKAEMVDGFLSMKGGHTGIREHPEIYMRAAEKMLSALEKKQKTK